MILLDEQADNGIKKRLAYRLVKKHIAGLTTDSAIRTALQFNGKGIHTTITFLNENGKDQKKARYNINTYSHLIRQLSRFRINSDISVRPSQLGYPENIQIFEKGLKELSSLAQSYGMSVWLENEDHAYMETIYGLVSTSGNSAIGVSALG